MARKFYLGLDQGTTGTTALLLDENWQNAALGYKEHTQIYACPGWLEHDPMEIWNAMLDSIQTALKIAGAEKHEIACIGLGNQGETCMIWDKNTGKPVYNAIVWQDRRTAGHADQLASQAGDIIRRKTGLVVDAYFSATKIKWILDNVIGKTKHVKISDLIAGTLDSWMIWKLTGGRVHVTDYSTASRTMLLNIQTGQWDDEILTMTGIPKSILPEICDSAMIYGYTDPHGYFGTKIPISGSVVDQQAALFGQTCYSPGSVKTTYGTGCFMMMNTGYEPVYSENGLLTTVAWKLGRKMTFALDGGIYIAGAAVQWLRDKLQIITEFNETETMALASDSNGGVFFVPAFAGLAAPYWDQYARGMIIGLTGSTTKEQIVRATLESVAYQVKDCLDAMNLDSKSPIKTMNVDGGMVTNSFLMQFQADILGIPIDIPVTTETTALGAAYLAAYGIGEFKNLDNIKDKWKLGCRFEPKMSEDQRELLLYQWHKAVERSRNWIEC